MSIRSQILSGSSSRATNIIDVLVSANKAKLVKTLDEDYWFHNVGGSGWGNNEFQMYQPYGTTFSDVNGASGEYAQWDGTAVTLNATVEQKGNVGVGNNNVKSTRMLAGINPDGTKNSPTSGGFASEDEQRTKAHDFFKIMDNEELTLTFHNVRLPEGAYDPDNNTYEPLWPALWVMGESIFNDKIEWSSCAEYDVMEWVPQYDGNIEKYHQTLHYNVDDRGSTSYQHAIYDGELLHSLRLFNDNGTAVEHTWSCKITRYPHSQKHRNKVEMYIDGVLSALFVPENNVSKDEFWYPYSSTADANYKDAFPIDYTGPKFLIPLMNIAIGGKFAGNEIYKLANYSMHVGSVTVQRERIAIDISVGVSDGNYTFDGTPGLQVSLGLYNLKGVPAAHPMYLENAPTGVTLSGGTEVTVGGITGRYGDLVLEVTHPFDQDFSYKCLYHDYMGGFEGITYVDTTPEPPEPVNGVVFSGAFGGALAVANRYTMPSGADSWAGFANEDTSLFPFTFQNGGSITFTGVAETSAEIYFKFEKLPHPDTEPSFVTESIVIATVPAQYTVPIADQGDNTFSSFLLYIETPDVAVTLNDVAVNTA